jgi:hypothetical protein
MPVIPSPQSAVPPFSVGPGMVTPNTVGSTYQNMSAQDYAEQNRLREEQERKREAHNAAVIAQRNAQQQAAKDAADRERVHAAFNQMYGPQLQNVYHDTMVQREGASGPMGIPRKTSGSFTGSPFSSNVPFGSTAVPGQRGSVAPYRMPQGELDQMLASMWTQQTDPYIRAAASMSGAMPKLPSMSMYGGGGRLPPAKKSITKPQEEQPGGIDWQKANVRPGY